MARICQRFDSAELLRQFALSGSGASRANKDRQHKHYTPKISL